MYYYIGGKVFAAQVHAALDRACWLALCVGYIFDNHSNKTIQ